jgi:hypothetical protein
LAELFINLGIRMGLSRKAYPVVIARRNDEAIQLFSDTSGLLHFVRNDEIGLLRRPLHINGKRFPYIKRTPQVFNP